MEARTLFAVEEPDRPGGRNSLSKSNRSTVRRVATVVYGIFILVGAIAGLIAAQQWIIFRMEHKKVMDLMGQKLEELHMAVEVNTGHLNEDSREKEMLTVEPEVITAAPGPQGARGERGEPGLIGLPGPKGESGQAGLPGSKGEIGLVGLPGPKGETGPVGSRGPKGETGPVGPPGPKGEAGSVGLPGLTGETGSVGLSGSKGEVGPPGPKGDRGPAGSDAEVEEIVQHLRQTDRVVQILSQGQINSSIS